MYNPTEQDKANVPVEEDACSAVHNTPAAYFALLATLAACMQQTSRCLQEKQDKLHAVLKALGCMCS